jgi:3-hydroxyisobutyrate dehydrogenase
VVAVDVAVLGTGGIGAGMARSLLRAGHAVTVWNRTPARAEPLADDGARVATDLPDAVAGAAVVVVVVFDLPAVLDVLDGIAGQLRPDAVVVSSATVGIGIDTVAARARDRGIRLVDAPVLGNPGPAERGELNVMAAGDPALRPLVAPVLEAISAKLAWVGDEPGPASRLKLAANLWVMSLNAAFAQSVALADGLGVDPHHVVDVLRGSAADSAYLQYKAAAVLGEDDTVYAAIDGVRKDLRLIAAAARDAALPTEVIDTVVDLYDRASAAGLGDGDVTRVTAVLRRSRPFSDAPAE